MCDSFYFIYSPRFLYSPSLFTLLILPGADFYYNYVACIVVPDYVA